MVGCVIVKDGKDCRQRVSTMEVFAQGPTVINHIRVVGTVFVSGTIDQLPEILVLCSLMHRGCDKTSLDKNVFIHHDHLHPSSYRAALSTNSISSIQAMILNAKHSITLE